MFLFCILLCLQLKELCHDNIESFVGACVEPGHICHLMQFCSRGSVQVSLFYLNMYTVYDGFQQLQCSRTNIAMIIVYTKLDYCN